jgi:hypothetical protein
MDLLVDEMPAELEFWRKQRFQSCIRDVYKEEVEVNSKDADSEHVVITIPKVNDYTMLRDSYLEVTCKVTKASSVACAHTGSGADKVGVVNDFGNSLWKQLHVRINGKIVEETGQLYPYRAYLKDLLCHQANALTHREKLIGWCKDTAAKFDKTAKGAGNTGQDARSAPFESSAEVTLTCPIHCDLAEESIVLPPNLAIDLLLDRSPHAFCLLAGDATVKYEVHITKLKLWVQRVTVNNELSIAHALKFRELPENKLRLPMRRVEMLEFVVNDKNIKSTINMFSNCALPDRIFVMFVPKTATTGSYSVNPFEFKHYSVKMLKVVVNSVSVPRCEYKPDFSASNGYIREYYSLLEELGAHEGNTTLDLTPADFAGGYTIFPFRFVSRHDGGDLLGVSKQGSANLHVEFSNALDDQIAVLVLAETRGSITIEKVLPIDV